MNMFASTPSTELETERRLVLWEVGDGGGLFYRIPPHKMKGGIGKGRMCRQCNRAAWEKKLSDEVGWGRG